MFPRDVTIFYGRIVEVARVIDQFSDFRCLGRHTVPNPPRIVLLSSVAPYEFSENFFVPSRLTSLVH